MDPIVILAPDLGDLQQAAVSGLVGGKNTPPEASASFYRLKIGWILLLKSIKEDFEEVPDLLLEIAHKRPAGQVLLGFAALTGDDTQIKKLAQDKKMSKGCDLLLANPIDRNGQGFEVNANGGFLLGPKGLVETMPVTSKLALAHQLLNALIALKPNISQKN